MQLTDLRLIYFKNHFFVKYLLFSIILSIKINLRDFDFMCVMHVQNVHYTEA